MYAQQQPEGGGAAPQPEAGGGKADESNVVDAEFEEVKDKKSA
jgi:hypothetical protein